MCGPGPPTSRWRVCAPPAEPGDEAIRTGIGTLTRHDRTDLPSLIVIGVDDIATLDVDGARRVASQAPITAVAGADRKNLPVFLVIDVNDGPALHGITYRHFLHLRLVAIRKTKKTGRLTKITEGSAWLLTLGSGTNSVGIQFPIL